jgi:hypothetical protein
MAAQTGTTKAAARPKRTRGTVASKATEPTTESATGPQTQVHIYHPILGVRVSLSIGGASVWLSPAQAETVAELLTRKDIEHVILTIDQSRP